MVRFFYVGHVLRFRSKMASYSLHRSNFMTIGSRVFFFLFDFMVSFFLMILTRVLENAR